MRPICPECGSEKLSVDLVALESVEVTGWSPAGPITEGGEVFYRDRTTELFSGEPYTCHNGHEFKEPVVLKKAGTP